MDMDYAYPRPNSRAYEGQRPLYRPPPSPYDQRPPNPYSSSPFYPRVAQPVGPALGRPPPPVPSNPAPSGIGIRVMLKPEYRVEPPPQLLPQTGEVPQSSFQFEFDLERRILEEAEKEGHSWGQEAVVSSNNVRNGESNASMGREDPAVSKYIAMGLNKEAVVMAVATYGDIQAKVLEFVQSYNYLHEMGFPPDAVAGALAMFDNDKDRALSHLIIP